MTARASGRGAAFFDLDRTLLTGGSGPLITAALAAEGLVPAWQAEVARRTFPVYDLLGETRLTMELTRRLVNRAKGWSEERVQRAAEAVIDTMSRRMRRGVSALFDEHRAAGRRVVLATTTAVPLIGPFAAACGADDLVATRWEATDGVFTGRLDGPFVWGRDKLNAVTAWCRAEGVLLSESFAYSDSVYDLPLLSGAGGPHAVNPDVRLRLIATARRWPIVDLG